MSFILDALRKSEHERQRQTTPDFANFQTVAPRTRLPAWTFVVGALLIVNLVAVLILVIRGERQTMPPAEALAEISLPTEPPASKPSAIVGYAQEKSAVALPQPAPVPFPSREIAGGGADESEIADANSEPTSSYEAGNPPEPRLRETSPLPSGRNDEIVPTIHELNLQGVNALPELHLDIHVYSTRPADRFVFINMRKYKEGAQTQEGIAVERITPDGAVLNRNGTRFLLPRQ